MSTGLTEQKQESATELMSRASNKTLTIGERTACIGKLLEQNAKQIKDALPRMMTPERFIRVVITSLRKNPSLLKCDVPSLLQAVMDAAQLGLEIGNNVLGHAYLVPFGSECTLVPGYKGLISLVRRSGEISTIDMECVYEGDKFKYTKGDTPSLKHLPNDSDPDRERKPVTHVYVVVRLKDGGIQRSVWPASKIDWHKEQYSIGWRFAEKGDRSKGGGKKDSPWHNHWETMAKKTVLRDMVNRGLLPVSTEIQRLTMQDEIYEQGMTIDSTMVESESIADLTARITSSAVSPEQEEPKTKRGKTEQELFDLANAGDAKE